MTRLVPRIRKSFSNPLFTGSLLFVVFIFLFEEWLFDFPQFKYFQIIMVFRPIDEKIIAVLSGLGAFIFCFWFAWAALEGSRIIRIVYTLLLTVSSLIQYGFWRAVERFMSPVDLQIAFSTPFATWKGAGTLFFNWRFILPILGFVFLLAKFGKNTMGKSELKKTGLLILLVIALGFSFAFTNMSLSLGPSLPSFYRTITQFTIREILPSEREIVEDQQRDTPDNNIILVIDESIRGDHLGVNGYVRDTTPLLDRLSFNEGIFRNWGVAVAGATCSHPSNALILTGVRPGLDEFNSTESYPTLFQYARAAGYETYYMDAQTNSFWNGLTDEDVTYIDSWIKAADLGDNMESDFQAADLIARIVTGNTGKFIVINKKGVHFLYEGSYPPDHSVWGPIPEEYVSQPSLVTNSYDNGLRYNVNTFFERLLADPEILANTTILYTSDHGQTLFENGSSWLHCNYTPMEATVPLIMIGNNLPPVANQEYPAGHANILPTMLDLMGVPGETRLHAYAPSLFLATPEMSASRYFLNGKLEVVEFLSP